MGPAGRTWRFTPSIHAVSPLQQRQNQQRRLATHPRRLPLSSPFMPTLKFAVLAGDYIGPEVMTEALRVLEHVATQEKLILAYELADIGGAGSARHGKALPDTTLQLCAASDAILFDSVGGPKWEKLPPKE